MKSILFTSFMIFSLMLFAQKHDNIWITGYSSNSTQLEFGETIYNFFTQPPEIYYQFSELNLKRTNASISNKEGQLLFYTNGGKIFNFNHQLMLNGDSLSAGEYADNFSESGFEITQGMLILPSPKNDSIYTLFHTETNTSDPNLGNQISEDTIIQNYHRSDKIQPTKNEAVICLKVKDFRKNPLANMPLWVWQKQLNQYWYGISDEKGEAFFLLPNDRNYSVNVDEESNYRKFTIPKEKNFAKTFSVVYMSTRIKEVERNDTIYQQLSLGQMPTQSRVLVNINVLDFQGRPLRKEELYFVSEQGRKVYKVVTNSKGAAILMLPKGDAYIVNTYIFPGITRKVYEDTPSSRTSGFKFTTISTAEFQHREKERAMLLARRDSLQREQRLRDSVRIAEMDGYNFYLQHYYAKKDLKKIETSVLKKAKRDQQALSENADYYAENNQEIKAMLYRNKNQWKKKRIVANIDCSMYQYIDELMVWNYTDLSEQNNNTYWLFNGFQNNAETSETNHHKRGVYHVSKNNIEGFFNTIDKIVDFSCSGNRLENVVEALIIGAENKSTEEELLFIADNYSDVSDLDKIADLTTPIRVLLTASEHGINEQYLEIAYKTKGSVHTTKEDVFSKELAALKDGDQLKIGRYRYTFLKGKFLKT
ncbi:MAG: hypothetical protein ACI9XO_002413 [Paraglaciecola sp.]|jgi:hypothetical protein